jgi:hypothetical protein
VTRWCELVGVINAVLGGPDLASSLLGLPNLIGVLSRATDYANIRQATVLQFRMRRATPG